MNFAYKSDNTVTGLNRVASLPGELTGICTPHDLMNGMNCDLYIAPGGVLAPKGHEDTTEVYKKQVISKALSDLWLCQDSKITDSGFIGFKNQSKLVKALRKEGKGRASASDIKTLDDNDLIDTWCENMEEAAESQGGQWIEDPLRTLEELIAFNPQDDIIWPPRPVL